MASQFEILTRTIRKDRPLSRAVADLVWHALDLERVGTSPLRGFGALVGLITGAG
jgi:hypothetical protein